MLSGAFIAFIGIAPGANAQVTASPTGSNLGTVVNQPSPGVFNITGGARPSNGPNLFHSFGEFSPGTGQSANFLNGSPGLTTTNILGRVTGGNPSNIFGTINTLDFPGANLFLMNPAGIVFGPNAQLNVAGSFHATTADYIKLSDGVKFDINASAGVLTSAPPVAFGFLGNKTPGSIEVRTGGMALDEFGFPLLTALPLQVPEGETLSLVGGNAPGSTAPGVAIGALDGSSPGYVLAPGGRVNLVSVASGGEATFDGKGFNVDGFPQLGTVAIGRGSGADVFSTGASIVDAKEIFIRAGRLEINDGLVAPGGFAFELTFVPGLSSPPNGGEVNIKVTGDMSITGTFFDGLTLQPPGVFIYNGDIFGIFGAVSPEAKLPDVNITAGSLSVSGFASILTNRVAPGEPGNVVINTNTLNVASGGSVFMFNRFAGPGGNLIINAKDINISGDGSPSPTGFEGLGAQGSVNFVKFSSGSNAPELITADSGNITINASNSLNVTGLGGITTDSRVFGSAGDIAINAGDIFLSGTGQFESGNIASQSAFAGDAGNVTINAARTITIKDGFRITSTSLGSGDAGTVNVTAGQSITLSNAGRILGRTNQPSDAAMDGLYGEVFLQLVTGPGGLREEMGNPNATMMELNAYLQQRGDIQIPALDLTPGDGGVVSVKTPVLSLNAGGSIETSTGWEGKAGQILANVGLLSINGGSFISSSSGILLRNPDGTAIGPAVGTGNAGDVNLAASDTITVAGQGSTISTTTFGSGAGGNVVLNANQVNVQNGGRVTSESGGLLGGAVAVGNGNSGSVSITAGNAITVSDPGSTASTSTFGGGAGGSVTLTAAQVNIQNGGLVESQSGGTLGGALVVGTGDAGTVTINATGANTLTISGTGSTVSTSTLGAGDGGDVILTSAGDVRIVDGGSVNADSLGGAGFTGTINITAGNSIYMDNGTISTRAVTSDGGNIKLTAPNIVQLNESQITTSVESGVGGGGNINIDPQFVIVNNSSIIANAFGGPGGNITIVANEFLQSATSVIEASSALSAPGTIEIRSPENNVENNISALPAAFIDASALLRGLCTARRTGAPSSFVVAGRGGLPVDADGYLPSLSAEVAAGVASATGSTHADAVRITQPFLTAGLLFPNELHCLR